MRGARFVVCFDGAYESFHRTEIQARMRAERINQMYGKTRAVVCGWDKRGWATERVA